MLSLCRIFSAPRFLAVAVTSLLLSGCANQQAGLTAVPQGMRSSVHGGQQPVSGATIQLYAVGTVGDGSPAKPLLTQPVLTDANGAFSITNAYTCPSATSLVYLVATGGNPGLPAGTNNAALALMGAIGPCGSLTSTTFLNINELTTVAAVWAFAPYMNSYSAIGSGPGDASALGNAFTLAAQYADVSAGTVPGAGVPAGTTVPVAQINTIADILASCINTAGGVAGDGSPCGNLFSYTAPTPSTAATNVIGAGLSLATYPASNVASLFDLLVPTAPYQPVLATPPVDFAVHLVAPTALVLSSSSITFSPTVLGFTAAMQSVTVTNPGGSAIAGIQVTSRGTNISDFVQSNTCSAVLPAAGICTIQVTFSPTALGQRNATLTIGTGPTAAMLTVALTGTATAGTKAGPITLLPASLSFTQVGIPQTLTLTNAGSTPLSIASINPDSAWSQTNTCGDVLAAQSICNIVVSATSLSTSVLTGQLKVVDDAASGSQTVALKTTGGMNVPGAPIDFGSWALSTPNLDQTFRVDTGSYYSFASLYASITGTNASDFSLPDGPGCSLAQTQCTITIRFSPGGVGMRTATLVTNYGNIPLVGTGLPAGPSFVIALASNTQGNFPLYANLGATSGNFPLTVTNNGSTGLQLSATMSGPNASEFSVTPGCTPLSTPMRSCSLGVTFTPTQLGLRTATATVTDSVSGLQHVIALSGTGGNVPPLATPNNSSFGAIQLGQTSTPKIITVTAPNGNPISVKAYVPGSSFLLDTGSCATSTPCQISVTFVATVAGSASANYTVTDNVTGRTGVFSVIGSGGLPVAVASTSNLAFGSRTVMTTSIPQIVTITNTGSAVLNFIATMLTGTNGADFSLQGNTCLTSVPVNGSCTVSISFAPKSSGARSAVLQIVSDATNSPTQVQLTGTGN
ncbi:hypothetical protein BH10ACI4_BH10ACI4_31990 [soil metagenome]